MCEYTIPVGYAINWISNQLCFHCCTEQLNNVISSKLANITKIKMQWLNAYYEPDLTYGTLLCLTPVVMHHNLGDALVCILPHKSFPAQIVSYLTTCS